MGAIYDHEKISRFIKKNRSTIKKILLQRHQDNSYGNLLRKGNIDGIEFRRTNHDRHNTKNKKGKLYKNEYVGYIVFKQHNKTYNLVEVDKYESAQKFIELQKHDPFFTDHFPWIFDTFKSKKTGKGIVLVERLLGVELEKFNKLIKKDEKEYFKKGYILVNKIFKNSYDFTDLVFTGGHNVFYDVRKKRLLLMDLTLLKDSDEDYVTKTLRFIYYGLKINSVSEEETRFHLFYLENFLKDNKLQNSEKVFEINVNSIKFVPKNVKKYMKEHKLKKLEELNLENKNSEEFGIYDFVKGRRTYLGKEKKKQGWLDFFFVE